MGRIASETAGGCTTTYTCDEYSQLIEEENEALDKTFQYEYNEVGNTVYLDDAWGNCTIKGTTTNYVVAHANPIRYRGYYYDEDTKLYYLNARYYSPEFRRFISPDDTYYLDPESVNGLNLYCYCNNDPVNYCDPSGHLAFWIITALIGAAVGVGITAAVDYIPDQEFNLHWGWYIGAGVAGASIGAWAGPAGMVAGITIGTLVGYLIDEFGDSVIDWIVGWFD